MIACHNSVADTPPVSACGDPLQPPRSSPWRGGSPRLETVCRRAPLRERITADSTRASGTEHTPGATPQPNRYRVAVQMPPLGRTKTGRHRPVALEEDPQAPGRELEDYLAALAPKTDVETTGTGR